MYKVLLGILALGLITANVAAESSDLSLGALIAHFVPELGYSSDPPACGWCAEYEASYAISSFEQQINRIDVSSYRSASWFIIAAWAEEKVWCGTELGFGDFDPAMFGFIEWTGCYPPDGGLEIPTAGWPGPNEGLAFVVTGEPWTGNFVSVLWFGGYAYGNYGSGVISIDIDPPTAFCGFSNCEAPPIPFEVVPEARGGMGINMDGIYVGPPTQPVGACCVPDPLGDCSEMLEEECLLLQGAWMGPETTCEPENPCEGEWVCCIELYCEIVSTQRECEELHGGVFHPEWNTCQPNPCCPISPASKTTWGRVKSIYR